MDGPQDSHWNECKIRCRKEWENVNDPPCHPSDKDWTPCDLCDHATKDNT